MTSISAQSRFVVRDDVKLHHLDWGNHGPHPIVLVHGSRLHAETMPRCTVERIEGAGHGLFTDQPEAFADSVERFLAAA